MDHSYIEDDSIHILLPYESEPRWSLNSVFECLDEGEHQVSRPFEFELIDESELHHNYIPYWSISPSGCFNKQYSRPNTLIQLIPIKKHLLDDSSVADEDDESASIKIIYDAYGRTGLFLYSNFGWEPPFERKIIDEFVNNTDQFIDKLEGVKEFIYTENKMINKIIIDICIEYFREKGSPNTYEWVNIAKKFYSKSQIPIKTNFSNKGILHFRTTSEYFVYFDQVKDSISNYIS